MVEVSLPVRADVLTVYLNDRRLADPDVREVGSLKRIRLGTGLRTAVISGDFWAALWVWRGAAAGGARRATQLGT